VATLVLHLLRARLRGWRLVGAAALVLFQPAVSMLAILTGPPLTGDLAAERIMTSVIGTGVFLGTAMVMMSASTLRDERDDHTIGYLALTPLPRWKLAVATVVAAVTACLVLAVVSSIGIGIVGLFVGATAVGVESLAYTIPAALGYGSVSALVGYLAPRGLLVMLFYVFVWEGLAGTLVPLAGNTSLQRISLSVYGAIAELPEIGMEIMSPIVAGAGGGMAKLLVTAAVATLVLWQVLVRRDLV
jgi:ABC-type transport system involved in multi-copper enzyme maturation permease subunit